MVKLNFQQSLSHNPSEIFLKFSYYSKCWKELCHLISLSELNQLFNEQKEQYLLKKYLPEIKLDILSYNSIYCWNLFINAKIRKLRFCFIPKVTSSVLSVGASSVFSLLRKVFFTVWEYCVWCESAMACRT